MVSSSDISVEKKLTTGLIIINTKIKLQTKFIYGLVLDSGKIISTIFIINAPTIIDIIHSFILVIIYPSLSLYVATALMEVNIAIVTKNIIVTAIIVTKIIIIRFATSFKNEDILSSPIGSIAMAHNLYTSITDNIFIIGIKHNPTKITSPTPPNTFFIS